MDETELCAGVREVEHTADVGIEVEAGSLAELFQRAAAGTMALVREGEEWSGEPPRPLSGEGPGVPEAGEPGGGGSEMSGGFSGERLVELEGEDVGALLVRWLRELLYLQEVEGFDYRDVEFERLEESRLRARVMGVRDPSPPVRELKAVTYHGLEVRWENGRWRARVIFDI